MTITTSKRQHLGVQEQLYPASYQRSLLSLIGKPIILRVHSECERVIATNALQLKRIVVSKIEALKFSCLFREEFAKREGGRSSCYLFYTFFLQMIFPNSRRTNFRDLAVRIWCFVVWWDGFWVRQISQAARGRTACRIPPSTLLLTHPLPH